MFVNVPLPQKHAQQYAGRATSERKERYEYGENARGWRIDGLAAVAANVTGAGGAAAARGLRGAMGDGEQQECRQVDGS